MVRLKFGNQSRTEILIKYAKLNCQVYFHELPPKSLLFFFLFFCLYLLIFAQEVNRTDEESADHRAVRVLQRSEVHRRHK